MMKLIICEKPSVTREFADALGAVWDKYSSAYVNSQYFITNSIGHLLSLNPIKMGFNKSPSFNIIIPNSDIYSENKKMSSHIKLLTKLLRNKEVTEVINACDPDRAGELIFWNLYNNAGCNLPVYRFWTSDVLSKKLINDLLSNPEPSDRYYPYAEAERVRFYSDLVLGYNCSTNYALKKNKFGLSIGRVQTPLLIEIVDRYLDNKNFTPSSSYKLNLNFIDDNGLSVECSSDNSIPKIPKSLEVLNESIKIHSVTMDSGKAFGQELYNKSTLLIDASKIYKISADKSSKILQDLYQDAKITSYPRTGSKYLDEKPETKSKFFNSIKNLGFTGTLSDVAKRGKMLFNNSKTEGHYALIILDGAKAQSKINSSTDAVSNILRLIRNRMLCRSTDPVQYDEKVVKLSIDALVDGELTTFEFTIKSRRITDEGWLKYDPSKKSTYSFNSSLFEMNDPIKTSDPTWSKSTTKAPALYNSGTVIQWMEKNKIGTPATIESFYKILISRKYIKEDKRSLIPTELGIMMHHDLKNLIVSDKAITAKMDQIMTDIINSNDQKGFENSKQLVDEFITQIYTDLLNQDIEKYQVVETKPAPSKVPENFECTCGSSDILFTKTFYQCKVCKRKLAKTILKKSLTNLEMKSIFAGNEVKISGMISSKTNKSFDSKISLDAKGKLTFNYK